VQEQVVGVKRFKPAGADTFRRFDSVHDKSAQLSHARLGHFGDNGFEVSALDLASAVLEVLRNQGFPSSATAAG
jgi:hypothetical protein